MALRINPQQVREAANSVRSAGGELRGVISRIDSASNSVTSHWEGVSKNRYMGEYHDLRNRIALLESMLLQISSALSNAAVRFAEADRQNIG